MLTLTLKLHNATPAHIAHVAGVTAPSMPTFGRWLVYEEDSALFLQWTPYTANQGGKYIHGMGGPLPEIIESGREYEVRLYEEFSILSPREDALRRWRKHAGHVSFLPLDFEECWVERERARRLATGQPMFE
jgi:hypothetical protein